MRRDAVPASSRIPPKGGVDLNQHQARRHTVAERPPPRPTNGEAGGNDSNRGVADRGYESVAPPPPLRPPPVNSAQSSPSLPAVMTHTQSPSTPQTQEQSPQSSQEQQQQQQQPKRLPPWGKYCKIEVIGAGAFGTAYLAVKRDVVDTTANIDADALRGGDHADAPAEVAVRIEDLVVVKRMFLQGSDEVLRAAAVEVRVLQALEAHPNTVRYLEHFVDTDGFINIIMEYCPGGDLEVYLRERRQRLLSSETASSSSGGGGGGLLRPEELLFLAFQLLAGLAHLHQHGVIHRDVKPSNLFLCAAPLAVTSARAEAARVSSFLDRALRDPLAKRAIAKALLQQPQSSGRTVNGSAGQSGSSTVDMDGAGSGDNSSSSSQSFSLNHFLRSAFTQASLADTTGIALKVADFGIAKVLETTQSVAKTVIGTPHYISPELCNGEPYNAAADAWAVGCIVFELATLGDKCFPGDNMMAIVTRIANGVVPAITGPCPSASAAAMQLDTLLRPLLEALLTKDPPKRLSCQEALMTFFLPPPEELESYQDNFEDPEDESF